MKTKTILLAAAAACALSSCAGGKLFHSVRAVPGPLGLEAAGDDAKNFPNVKNAWKFVREKVPVAIRGDIDRDTGWVTFPLGVKMPFLAVAPDADEGELPIEVIRKQVDLRSRK